MEDLEKELEKEAFLKRLAIAIIILSIARLIALGIYFFV